MKNLFLMISLIFISSCSETGWIGYYSIKKQDGSENKISYNTDNGIVETLKAQQVWIEMPRDCSGFKFSGLITPFTPPLPLLWFRSWSTQDCNYFTVKAKPDINIKLAVNGETFLAETKKGLYGYTEYIFPIRAKDIDSGSIIIETNGEKIEIPFEYKYFKFWY